MPLKKSLRTHLGIIIALLLAFTLIVGNAAAQDPPPDPIQPNIVGGQPADPHEYPWQALVYAGGYMCGGSLIDAEWVLTAAHCVTNGSTVYAPSAFDIRLGEHNRYTSDGTEQAKTVDQVVPHPSYDAYTSDYDVALLHLSSPASLNSAVATIALNSLADVDGQMSTVTGWGTTSYGGSTSDVLMEVQVPIVSNATCNAAYGSITSRMLCAGYAAGGKDSCQGDSGGPLIIPDGSGGWRQAGVVSWGSGCADPGYYGVYSRVSSVKSWIDSYLAGAVTPTPSPTPVTPASNDDFSAAAMTALPYSSNQNTATATTATDDPIFTCGGGGQKYHTVWYKYAATSTGTLAVNTNGSNYDTVLAVWTGSRGALQNVGCDDDSGLDNQSDLQVSVVAGTTYFIEAAGYFPDSSGSLNLSASFIAPPVPPDINVTPASVELTLPGGLTTTQTLTIENTGDGVLSFNLAITGAEISAGSMAIRQSENDWRAVAFPADKIDPALQQDIGLMSGEPISFMVYLTQQADERSLRHSPLGRAGPICVQHPV